MYEGVRIEKYAAEGKSIAYIEDKTVFVHQAIPGDVVNLRITKKKKDWQEAHITALVSPSPWRQTPFCSHFGVCGGCKWQMLAYERQVMYKKEQVLAHLRHIAKVSPPSEVAVYPCAQQQFYRNRLEYTFSAKDYIPYVRLQEKRAAISYQPVLGFHAPRVFDKVVGITRCFLMTEAHNDIRNALYHFARQKDYAFYDQKAHTGWLRNLHFRWARTGELMLILVLAYEAETDRKTLLDFLRARFATLITSLYYIINPKKNDAVFDLTPVCYFGAPYITEHLGHLHFQISPKSFFQTNTAQAEQLYRIIDEYIEPHPDKTVYDLYCGTGTIALYIAQGVKSVFGIEIVADAIQDACRNADRNKIANVSFAAGDVLQIEREIRDRALEKAQVIVVNPPRAGLTKEVISLLGVLGAEIIVYTSCNSATLSRDIQMLQDWYRITRLSVVDMFPHTHHTESVVQLKRKDGLGAEGLENNP